MLTGFFFIIVIIKESTSVPDHVTCTISIVYFIKYTNVMYAKNINRKFLIDPNEVIILFPIFFIYFLKCICLLFGGYYKSQGWSIFVWNYFS